MLGKPVQKWSTTLEYLYLLIYKQSKIISYNGESQILECNIIQMITKTKVKTLQHFDQVYTENGIVHKTNTASNYLGHILKNSIILKTVSI